MGKGKKKTGGAKLWMRFDRSGRSELVECDKSAIVRRAAIPARDLRILGPVLKNDYFNKVEEILDKLLDEVLKTGYLI